MILVEEWYLYKFNIYKNNICFIKNVGIVLFLMIVALSPCYASIFRHQTELLYVINQLQICSKIFKLVFSYLSATRNKYNKLNLLPYDCFDEYKLVELIKINTEKIKSYRQYNIFKPIARQMEMLFKKTKIIRNKAKGITNLEGADTQVNTE